jgi:hypothetical protein
MKVERVVSRTGLNGEEVEEWVGITEAMDLRGEDVSTDLRALSNLESRMNEEQRAVLAGYEHGKEENDADLESLFEWAAEEMRKTVKRR